MDSRRFLNALAEAALAVDSHGTICAVNPAAERLLGWPAAELQGRPATLLLPEGGRRRRPEALARFLRRRVGAGPLHARLACPEGEVAEVDLLLSVLPDGDGPPLLVATLRDAVGRRQLEGEAEAAQYLRAAARAIAGLSSHLDLDHVLETAVETLVCDLDGALARIWLYDPETHKLQLRASAGAVPPSPISASEIIDLATNPYKIAMVARSRQPIVRNGLRGDLRFEQRWVETHGMVAAAIFPLLVRGELRGVLAYFSRRELSETLVELLTGFASITATALSDVQRLATEAQARADAEAQRRTAEELAQALRRRTEALEELNRELRTANVEIRAQRDELEQLREESETLRRIGNTLAAELDLERLLQGVTDAATRLVEAEFGAFFYNITTPEGDAYMLYTLSGAPREAFAAFPLPRKTPIFEPTFTGTGIVRLEDVTRDPRYGKNPPYYGMPEGHLPVRSYLAVPVVSRSGEVLGGLFFGHSRPGRFQPSHERMVAAIAAQAAIAIDNARLFQAAREAEEALRERAEALENQQQWLEAVLDLLPVPLLFVEPGTARILFANRAADEVAGGVFPRCASAEEYAAAYFCTDASGRRIPTEAMPGVRVARGERLTDFEMDWHLPTGIRSLLVSGETLPPLHGHPAMGVIVFQDITRLKQIEAELRSANAAKDDFLAMLAHELRNPLAPILTAVEVLRRMGPQTPLLMRNRDVIARQVRHLADLTDDLLDVSRLQRGKIALHLERLDLARLVREAAEDHRAAAEAAGLALHVEAPETPLWVEGDRVRLAQVLSNLLQNALTFTPDGGEVRLALRREEGTPGAGGTRRVSLSIADTGIGIPAELLPRIWETFVQADRSLDRSRGGLGLGLALVKGLVELHGGEVRVASPGLGKGSEFTVLLPLAEPETLSGAPLDEAAQPDEEPPRPLRVLIIEDNRDAAQSLRDLLELSGYEVAVAHSGAEGVRLARAARPHAILCDIGLPEMDGYEVAARLRNDPATAGARLVAVTGYGSEEDRRRSSAAGFEQHFTKPVDPNALARWLAGIEDRG